MPQSIIYYSQLQSNAASAVSSHFDFDFAVTSAQLASTCNNHRVLKLASLLNTERKAQMVRVSRNEGFLVTVTDEGMEGRTNRSQETMQVMLRGWHRYGNEN
jgi:hypothetical protein